MKKTKEIAVFNNELFGDVHIMGTNESPWFIGKEIAEKLGYKNTRDAMSRHVDTDDKVVVKLDTPSGAQNTTIINESGMYSLVLQSKLPDAKKFKRWVTNEVLPSIRKTGSYESLATQQQMLQLQESFKLLADKLDKSGLFTPLTNYRYEFDKFNVLYKDATGDDGHRGIHEACGDYYGFPVPYSKDIQTTLRDYVLLRISDNFETAVESLKKFIMGIKSKTIVLSPMGHWVNLNGFGGNDVEWNKMLHEFNHKCAYCGRSDVPLIPEHIYPQSLVSKDNPNEVDLIGNVVPSCGCCNADKGKQDMELWFKSSPQYNLSRLRKIKRHILIYSLKEL